jgi:hypothetical protein
MTNSKKIDSFTELLKTKEIVPFCCQYICSLLLFVVNKKQLFTKNLAVHNHDTRSANNFHLPITNLTKCRKGAHYTEINTFSSYYIKCVANKTQVFKSALKRFLFSNSFYSIEE